jgi:hypothetical protein
MARRNSTDYHRLKDSELPLYIPDERGGIRLMCVTQPTGEARRDIFRRLRLPLL